MKLVKKYYPLVLILAIAACFRFYKLSTIPIGFNDDEAAFGYNAYSILKTAKDEWGRFLPFPVFESFGDWKLVGYLYPVAISEAIFGLNEFATRFPSAFFGVLAVFAAYLLAKNLFDKEVALVASFLLAISPWHIVASRNAYESDILIFTITLSTYFFLKGLTSKRYFLFSFLGYTFSFYVYRSAWLFVPLFVLTLLLIYKSQVKRHKKFLFKIFILCVIGLLPLLPTVFSFRGQARFVQESFIAGVQRAGIINNVIEGTNSCTQQFSYKLCQLVYNKYNFFLSTYINNYFSNLSPATYYLERNENGYQSFPKRSLFFIFELPLFVIGLFFLIRSSGSSKWLLFSWILIVPIGASITSIGNPGRLNILMPSTQIIAAFCLVSIYKILKPEFLKRSFALFFAAIIAMSAIRLVIDVIYYYPKIYARSQRYGYKQLFDSIENEKNNYQEVAISRKWDDSKQFMLYLFFEKYDPKKYLKEEAKTRYREPDMWQVVERIDNIRFYPATPPINGLPKKSLIVLPVREKNEIHLGGKLLFVIDDPKGDRLFEVYDFEKP